MRNDAAAAKDMETAMQPNLRPYRPISPGELLQDELAARGWTAASFSNLTGYPTQTIDDILKGEAAITAAAAGAFSQALGSSAQYWLALEAAYQLDLQQARERRPSASR